MTKRLKLEADLDDVIAAQVEAIREQIEEAEEKLAPYMALKAKVDKLRAAERALLGTGSRLTGQGGTRVTQDDMVRYLRENPGSGPNEIAKHMGVDGTIVRSHLSRGKNERFLNKDQKWWLRDPKAGIDTVDDIPNEEDDDGEDD